MKTRSTIAIEFANGTIGQIYCHYRGGIKDAGQTLLTDYTDPFKVCELIELGALSCLAPEIGNQHKFDGTDSGNWCMFYGRDGKVAGVQAPFDISTRYFKNFADYTKNRQCEEYEYILRQVNGEAVWFVNQGNGYESLTEVVKETNKEQVTA